MLNDPLLRKVTRVLHVSVGFISLFIKISQILMLIAGLSAFLYDAYELSLEPWFSLKGVKIDGYTVGHEVHYETRQKFPDSSAGNTLSDQDYVDIPVYRPTTSVSAGPGLLCTCTRRSMYGDGDFLTRIFITISWA